MQTPRYTNRQEAIAAAKAALLSIVDNVAGAYADSYMQDMAHYNHEQQDMHSSVSHDAIGVALGELAVGLHDAIGSTKPDGAALTDGEANALAATLFIAYVEHDFTSSYTDPANT